MFHALLLGLFSLYFRALGDSSRTRFFLGMSIAWAVAAASLGLKCGPF